MNQVILIVMLFLEGAGHQMGPSVSVHTTEFSNMQTCEIVAEHMQTKYRAVADLESKSTNKTRQMAIRLRGILITDCLVADKYGKDYTRLYGE